jgi:hypothetical protein
MISTGTPGAAVLHRHRHRLHRQQQRQGASDCERSTALGIELQFELLLAFVAVYELWEIPGILEENGYLEESEADEIYFVLPPLQAERKLHRYVVRAYLKYCNRSQSSH